jgi:hypothetical protein
MAQIVWCNLVDVIVKPVSKQQIAVAAPGGARFVLRVVLRKIVVRNLRVQTGFHIAEIFACQGIGIVLRVAGDKGDALIFAGEQIRIALFRLREDLEIGVVTDKPAGKSA